MTARMVKLRGESISFDWVHGSAFDLRREDCDGGRTPEQRIARWLVLMVVTEARRCAAPMQAKAKIRTLRDATEKGLGRVTPKDHDELAWLLKLAAKTVDWYGPGADGKTPMRGVGCLRDAGDDAMLRHTVTPARLHRRGNKRIS